MDEEIINPIFDEEIESEETLSDPFNPNDISIDKKTILVETCIKRLVQKTIVLSPDFQRYEVWNEERKSRLIESLMLKIPIPMFYVSADEKSVFTVVDGLQRLSAFRDFIIGKDFYESNDNASQGNGMRLSGLEFWTQYNGYTFNELPTYLQNRITETELTFTIINPGTPDEVKRNIFKRINTGGLFLTLQEIRNALYTGKSTELLNRLSKAPEFLNATANAVSSKRMEDLELILRCLAFMIRNEDAYPKNSNMDAFLCDTMQIINAYPIFDNNEIKKLVQRGRVTIKSIRNNSLKELERLFVSGMERSYQLFGQHCFRRSYGDSRRSPINKALFEMWGSTLSLLTEDEFLSVRRHENELKQDYYQLLGDIEFQNLISRDSWKFTSVQKRFEKIHQLIDKYKQDDNQYTTERI